MDAVRAGRRGGAAARSVASPTAVSSTCEHLGDRAASRPPAPWCSTPMLLLRLARAAAAEQDVPARQGPGTLMCGAGRRRLHSRGAWRRAAMALRAVRAGAASITWWGREGRRQPRTPCRGRPCTESRQAAAEGARRSSMAMALAAHQGIDADGETEPRACSSRRSLRRRDCSTAAALRIGELVGLDAAISADVAGCVDRDDASAHVLGKGSNAAQRAGSDVAATARRSTNGSAAARRSLDRASRRSSSAVAGIGSRQAHVRLRLKAVRHRRRPADAPASAHAASFVRDGACFSRVVTCARCTRLLGHAKIATMQIYTKLGFWRLSKVYDAAHPRAKKPGCASGTCRLRRPSASRRREPSLTGASRRAACRGRRRR